MARSISVQSAVSVGSGKKKKKKKEPKMMKQKQNIKKYILYVKYCSHGGIAY